jgi:hypothetical protein
LPVLCGDKPVVQYIFFVGSKNGLEHCVRSAVACTIWLRRPAPARLATYKPQRLLPARFPRTGWARQRTMVGTSMREQLPRTKPIPPEQRTKNPCRRTPCRSRFFSTSNRTRAAPHVSLSFCSRTFRGAAPRTAPLSAPFWAGPIV